MGLALNPRQQGSWGLLHVCVRVWRMGGIPLDFTSPECMYILFMPNLHCAHTVMHSVVVVVVLNG